MRKTARVPAIITTLAAATALVLTGCGSNDKTDKAHGTERKQAPARPAGTSRRQARLDFQRATGEVKVVAPTASHAPASPSTLLHGDRTTIHTCTRAKGDR